MDLLVELEGFAADVVASSAFEKDAAEMIPRWQRLFGYSISEAQSHIEQQQGRLDSLIPLSCWKAVREQQEQQGHDRATYSHWLEVIRKASRKGQTSSHSCSRTQAGKEYLVHLGGPLHSRETLAQILGARPENFVAQSLEHDGVTYFCRIDAAAKTTLLAHLAQTAPSFSPLIVSSSYARKDLCTNSTAPFLGKETTLPQFRLAHTDNIPRPAQNEYPVWYFSYGTLSDPDVLHRVFSHLDKPSTHGKLVPARVRGGKLKTWGAGKYRALVDGLGKEVVEGTAFLVRDKEHEDALCLYETGSYEVARCDIEMLEPARSDVVQGCVFRFIGTVD